jgi:hypothetical protein
MDTAARDGVFDDLKQDQRSGMCMHNVQAVNSYHVEDENTTKRC